MSDLNERQQLIVDDRQGARCVIAGPGTGKTKTMVALFKTLKADGMSRVRGITFSTEAAATITKRAGVSKGVFSTFHSLGYQIISDTGRKPVEPELRHRLLTKLYRKWGVDYKSIESFISRMRHDDITPQEAIDSGKWGYGHTSAYAEYEKVRAAEGWIDFDSMLVDAVRYLENNSAARDRWQFEHLIVDEAQDTDDLQWRMMQLLSIRHGNITVVGDPNQCIYGFRGAVSANLIHFEKWFPSGRYFYLGKNYRSTKTIVDFVRENTPEETPMSDLMVAARPETGIPIEYRMFYDPVAEAESAITISQIDPLNTIILARTNETIGILEDICTQNNIKYHLLGKTGFWKRGEIRRAIEKLKEYPSLSTVMAMNSALPHVEAHYAVEDRTDKDDYALGSLKTLREIGKRFPKNREFLVYANKAIHRRNSPKGVTLSTIHQAKGGEWANVLLVGARNGMIPHIKGDHAEEKRIFFVAISRAVDRLRVSFTSSPSPYLDRWLPASILDELRKDAGKVERIQTQQRLFA